MRELLNAYYDVRRENETLRDIIDRLQDKIKILTENYNYVVEMSHNYEDISQEQAQQELADAIEAVRQAEAEEQQNITKVSMPKYKIGGGATPAWGVNASVSGVDKSQKTPKGNVTMVDYEYDTGHVIPGRHGDDTHNWG